MKRMILIGILLGLFQSVGWSQDIGIFDALVKDDLIEISIKTDLNYLLEHKYNDTYQKAALSYQDAAGLSQRIPVKLKARGKFRRRVCDFPPIKLNFSKKQLNQKGFNGAWDKLKLVTHCLDNPKTSKENIVKEWLAYKLYENIHEDALRAQLVRITYIDSKNPKQQFKRYGILIEDIDQLAARKNTKVLDSAISNIDPSLINSKALARVALFQYMIGNTDWDPSIPRNIKLLESKEGYIPVPYDFDFSAMVLPSYIRLTKKFGQEDIKDRVYLGGSSTFKHVKPMKAMFENKKEVLYSIIKKAPLINRGLKRDLRAYLKTFFEDNAILSRAFQPALVKQDSQGISPKG